jgi:hypothetical protein
MKKTVLLMLLFTLLARMAFSQKMISDEAIRYQQERMVFKQWDSDKFKPSPGLLNLNPLYWLTWAWHTDYPKHDLRPLGPQGPQTQQLALVAAMQNVEQAYKLQADSLRQTAARDAVRYSGLLSDADPLWILYYRDQFGPLLSQTDQSPLDGLGQKEKDNLVTSHTLDWYLQEIHSLTERLNAARTTTVDRGSRLLAYQRLLDEYLNVQATWAAKKQNTRWFLELSESSDKLKKHEISLSDSARNRTDRQIAEDIVSHSKL